MAHRNPEVGKFIVLETAMVTGTFAANHEITRISGKRVYFNNRHGEEKYTFRFAAICDTKEEADKLTAFGKACLEEWMVMMMKRHQEEAAKLLT